MRLLLGTIAAGAMAAFTAGAAETDLRIPLAGLRIVGPATPTEAETLAVRRFNEALRRIAGTPLPVLWGDAPEGARVLRVGHGDTVAALVEDLAGADADLRNQAYSVVAGDGGITVAGLGQAPSARASLGLSYGLGELIRRLDLFDDGWAFALPREPLVSRPAMPNRTLYIMNSVGWAARGLSLDYDDPQSLEDYVDALIDAGYSRLSLWQWYMIYLYPGNFEERRADNQRIHRGMRHLLDYARRRGLEVYHMLTPMHANPDLLPDDPKYVATGYYGRTSVCWSQPEARELARAMARHEMEYYGPVDGYIVWFYDPGGCFCPECRANQGANLFEQLMLVVDLAETISPGAAFQACLWPTWCFHEAQWGIDFPRDDVKAFVREFLDKALDRFGPRGLTIMDSCDTSFTHYEFVIYDGTVKPEAFKRNGFMHRVLGTPGEASYPFSPFMFRYQAEVMGQARDRGLEEALFSAIYIGSTFPAVFAFADTLWHRGATADGTIGRYAATVAKGEARAPFIELLTALEDLGDADSYEEKEAALLRAESAWKVVEASPRFFGDRDAMGGYMMAQRRYLEMARARDQAAFDAEYARFIGEVGAIPMYREFMEKSMTVELCVKFHVGGCWRGPVGDTSTVGLPGGDTGGATWIGVPETNR